MTGRARESGATYDTRLPARTSSPTIAAGPAPVTPGIAPESPVGLAAGIAAYLWWGVVVLLFFKLTRASPDTELIASRAVFGLPTMLALLLVWGGWRSLRQTLTNAAVMRRLALSSVLLLFNWSTFVYCVANDRTLEASLGYYLNPLVSIALGMVFLGERLRRRQAVAVIIASASVAFLTVWTLASPDAPIAAGVVSAAGGGSADPGWLARVVATPWPVFVVSLSFGFYGLVRKTTEVHPAAGLSVEMAFMLPLLLAAWAVLVAWPGASVFLGQAEAPPGVRWLLLASGVVTAVPLVLFAIAARRVPLQVIGLMQFIAPTCQFFAALLYREREFTWPWGVTFVGIWLAVGIYAADAVVTQRRRRRERRAAAGGTG